MKTKNNYKSMPPEKIIDEINKGNLQITTKGIRDWIKFIVFLVMILLQGAGIYYAIKLDIQSISINLEFIKTKNSEQDRDIREIKEELKNIYHNKK